MVNTALSALAPAIPAQHGDQCACRSCASGAYASLLEKSDYQRHEITRLTEQLSKSEMARKVERYRYLSLVIAEAIRTGDEKAWARAVPERMELGVAVQMAADEAAAKEGV